MQHKSHSRAKVSTVPPSSISSTTRLGAQYLAEEKTLTSPERDNFPQTGFEEIQDHSDS